MKETPVFAHKKEHHKTKKGCGAEKGRVSQEEGRRRTSSKGIHLPKKERWEKGRELSSQVEKKKAPVFQERMGTGNEGEKKVDSWVGG